MRSCSVGLRGVRGTAAVLVLGIGSMVVLADPSGGHRLSNGRLPSVAECLAVIRSSVAGQEVMDEDRFRCESFLKQVTGIAPVWGQNPGSAEEGWEALMRWSKWFDVHDVEVLYDDEWGRWFASPQTGCPKSKATQVEDVLGWVKLDWSLYERFRVVQAMVCVENQGSSAIEILVPRFLMLTVEREKRLISLRSTSEIWTKQGLPLLEVFARYRNEPIPEKRPVPDRRLAEQAEPLRLKPGESALFGEEVEGPVPGAGWRIKVQLEFFDDVVQVVSACRRDMKNNAKISVLALDGE